MVAQPPEKCPPKPCANAPNPPRGTPPEPESDAPEDEWLEDESLLKKPERDDDPPEPPLDEDPRGGHSVEVAMPGGVGGQFSRGISA